MVSLTRTLTLTLTLNREPGRFLFTITSSRAFEQEAPDGIAWVGRLMIVEYIAAEPASEVCATICALYGLDGSKIARCTRLNL